MVQRKQMYQVDIIELKFTKDKNLRWGQAIINKYPDYFDSYNETQNSLYFQRDDDRVWKFMQKFFEDNQIPVSPDDSI